MSQPGDGRTGPLIVEPGLRAYPNPKETDMTTADQDWKTGPLNRQKYVILKACEECGGGGESHSFLNICLECNGAGGTRVDPNAAYFVLRIDGNHDPNARFALSVYADTIEAENPEFAAGIRAWLEETAVAAN